MLVLSRKSNESVIVGGSDACQRIFKVTVLEVNGGRVKLGFECDSDVPVHRSEVYERMQDGSRSNGPEGNSMRVGW
jgi:carbon storage regulator